MFRKLQLLILAMLIASCLELKAQNATVMNPNDILFSLPTLCDPIPATDATAPSGNSRILGEDDWRQIEFVCDTNRAYIQQQLTNLIAFKQQHQKSVGWTKVYIRKEHPVALASAGLQFTNLPALSEYSLAFGNANVLGGFAISDGGDWFIYGQRTPQGHVLHLAVSPGRSKPSEQFARALSQIAKTDQLLLVDWYAASIVDVSSTDSVLAWAYRYQR